MLETLPGLTESTGLVSWYLGCADCGRSAAEFSRRRCIQDAEFGVLRHELGPASGAEKHQPDRCDIHSDQISSMSGFACAGTAIKTIKRGDTSTNIVYAGYDNSQPMQVSIYWKEGSVLNFPGGDDVYPANPLALKDPGSTYCQNLFIDNYKKCSNSGVGGTIHAGCLVYDLKAKHD